MNRLSSISGYAENAETLAAQYESVSFADVHGRMQAFFPPPPAHVLDIGAGSGRDAAALAGLGYDVTAVEPTAELRQQGQAIHAAMAIRWIDDLLPDLANVDGSFDLVLATAVLMHLDQIERRRAVERLASLMQPGARLVMQLRYGPVPAGRRMFDVQRDEIETLGHECGLAILHSTALPDVFERPGITWTGIVLQRQDPG